MQVYNFMRLTTNTSIYIVPNNTLKTFERLPPKYRLISILSLAFNWIIAVFLEQINIEAIALDLISDIKRILDERISSLQQKWLLIKKTLEYVLCYA